MGDAKPFKLIWTSQNETVNLDRAEYARITDASADVRAAKEHLHAQYLATDDHHYPHDIEAGTWRVVPVEPPRTLRNEPA